MSHTLLDVLLESRDELRQHILHVPSVPFKQISDAWCLDPADVHDVYVRAVGVRTKQVFSQQNATTILQQAWKVSYYCY